VISILRSGRRSPWTEEPTPVEDMDLAPEPSPETALQNADEARRLMAVLRGELSTRSMLMFEGLYIEQKTVQEICDEFGLSKNALYAWRSRLRRRIEVLTKKVRGEGVSSP
ncbi:MAG: sigma-70 family RNA polymerase sigma factor, partial [Myxococcota bacterium]